jgi:hypothetical protein
MPCFSGITAYFPEQSGRSNALSKLISIPAQSGTRHPERRRHPPQGIFSSALRRRTGRGRASGISLLYEPQSSPEGQIRHTKLRL